MLKADSKLDRNSVVIEIRMFEVRSQLYHVLYSLKKSDYELLFTSFTYDKLYRVAVWNYIYVYTHLYIHIYVIHTYIYTRRYIYS